MKPSLSRQRPKQQNQKLFIQAYIASFGIISKACFLTDVSRQTHYKWLKTDSSYKRAFELAKGEAGASANLFVEKEAVKIAKRRNKRMQGFIKSEYGEDILEQILSGKVKSLTKGGV